MTESAAAPASSEPRPHKQLFGIIMGFWHQHACVSTTTSGTKSGTCAAVLLLVGVIGVAPRALAQEPPTLTDDQILSRSLAELKNSQVFQQLDQYSFTKRISVEGHDKNGKILNHDEREYEFVPRPDGRYDVRLLSVKGAPPTEKELKQHEEAMRKEFAKSDAEVAEEKKKAQEENTMLSQDFLEYFDFKFTGREEWGGDPTYRIEFTPKSESAQLKEKKERILQNMGGQMWVHPGSYRILATEMHTLHNVKVWGGISGVDNLVSHVEYVQDADGNYLLKLDSAQWEIRVGFNKLRFLRKEEYSDYHKPEAKSAPTSTQP